MESTEKKCGMLTKSHAVFGNGSMMQKKTRRKAKMVFDDEYPVYMTCWYENGVMKEQGRYKDGYPRWDG